MNNYIKVLNHLQQFEGDGKMHEVESVLGDLDRKAKEAVFRDLVQNEYILLEKGYDNSWTTIAYMSGNGINIYLPMNTSTSLLKVKLLLKAHHI